MDMKPQEVINKLLEVSDSLYVKFGNKSFDERYDIGYIIGYLKEEEKKKTKRKSDREAKKIMDSRYVRNK